MHWYGRIVNEYRPIDDESFSRLIYCITNTVNGKKYIGSTYDIKTRFYGHLHALKNGNHHSGQMQDDYNRYGNVFTVEVLEVCHAMDSAEKERNWMLRHKTYFDKYGYNTGDWVVQGKRRAQGLKSRTPKRLVTKHTRTFSTFISAYNCGLSKSDVSKRYGLDVRNCF